MAVKTKTKTKIDQADRAALESFVGQAGRNWLRKLRRDGAPALAAVRALSDSELRRVVRSIRADQEAAAEFDAAVAAVPLLAWVGPNADDNAIAERSVWVSSCGDYRVTKSKTTGYRPAFYAEKICGRRTLFVSPAPDCRTLERAFAFCQLHHARIIARRAGR